MEASSVGAPPAGVARYASAIGLSVRSAIQSIPSVLLPIGAFGLYWLSALVLDARGEVYLSGADTHLYKELVNGDITEKLGGYYPYDRITRFHPITTVIAVVWMKTLDPLTAWITPQQLLKALFSVVGAVGVAVAMTTFSAL